MMVNPSSEGKPFEATDFEAALAHLAKLQEQLDSLRSTIPSIVAPLSIPDAGRKMTYAQIKAAALQSTSDMQAFRDNWKSEVTQDILKRGRESLKADADLNKASHVSRWGWRQSEDEDEKK